MIDILLHQYDIQLQLAWLSEEQSQSVFISFLCCDKTSLQLACKLIQNETSS